ncbi:Pentatricopeptide repeat-containing protein [Porphyridium purpureum]|uniref:Pentatricopeptide repeat-containing protein n=1 Tax=Porphyridium purpureum TaxID=35688 RepID=A0A5J4YLJ2_PORPP|nr:Pentatricopeptide repeat-containing protein [Porphyridium purpureum]|eukprot:POR0086..scf249_10
MFSTGRAGAHARGALHDCSGAAALRRACVADMDAGFCARLRPQHLAVAMRCAPRTRATVIAASERVRAHRPVATGPSLAGGAGGNASRLVSNAQSPTSGDSSPTADASGNPKSRAGRSAWNSARTQAARDGLVISAEQKRAAFIREQQRRFVLQYPPENETDERVYSFITANQLDQAQAVLLSEPVPTASVGSVVLVARALRHAGALSEALEVFRSVLGPTLTNVKTVLTHDATAELIACLAASGEHELVLQTVDFAYTAYGRLGPLMYRAKVLALAALERTNRDDPWPEILSTLRELHAKGLYLKVQTYNHLLHLLGQRGFCQLENCQKLFELMETEFSVCADTVTFNTLMNLHLQQSNADEVAALWFTLRKRAPEVQPDRVSYNLFISSCRLTAKPRIDAAMSALQEMRNSSNPSLRPDQITYNCVLAVCEKAVEPRVAQRVLREMKRARFEPDERTHVALLNLYARCNDVQAASTLFRELQKSQDKVLSLEIYTTMINMYAEMRRVQDAFDLFVDMVRSPNISPSVGTFNALMNACRSVGDIDRAQEVLKKMASAGLRPDVITYSVFVDLLGRAGRINDIWATLKEMDSRQIQPNLITLTSALNGCVRAGDLKAAEQLLGEMPKRGMRPNAFTYSVLIEGYSLRGDLDRALYYYRELREQLSSADMPRPSALRALFKASCRGGDVQTLSYLLETVLNQTLLVKGAYSNQEIDRFLRWLSDIRSEARPQHAGVEPMLAEAVRRLTPTPANS